MMRVKWSVVRIWNVGTYGITFPRDDKRTFGMLWKYLAHEQLQEEMDICSSCKGVIGYRFSLIDVRETNTGRLVNENQCCFLIPPIGIINSAVPILVDQTGTQLLKHP